MCNWPITTAATHSLQYSGSLYSQPIGSIYGMDTEFGSVLVFITSEELIMVTENFFPHHPDLRMWDTERGREARVHHRGSCKHDWCPSQLSWSVASSAVSLLSVSRCTVTSVLWYQKWGPFWNFSQDPQNFLSKLVTWSVPIHYIPDLIQITIHRRSFDMYHDTVIYQNS